MKLKCDETLSSSAFKNNLRRYNWVLVLFRNALLIAPAALLFGETVTPVQVAGYATTMVGTVVGRCRLTVSNPALKAPTVSALEATI